MRLKEHHMKVFAALLFSVAMTFGFTQTALASCGECEKKAPHSHEKHCKTECKDTKDKNACQKKCEKKHDNEHKDKKKKS